MSRPCRWCTQTDQAEFAKLGIQMRRSEQARSRSGRDWCLDQYGGRQAGDALYRVGEVELSELCIRRPGVVDQMPAACGYQKFGCGCSS